LKIQSTLNPAELFIYLYAQVRNQDCIFVLRGVTAGAHEVAWTWLKVFMAIFVFPLLALLLPFCFCTDYSLPMVQENWDYIAETFTGHMLTYFISVTVSLVHVITSL
jgi:puromycin-sensitive aminopeptidase